MASICEITLDVSEESGLFWEDEIKETGKKIKALLLSHTVLWDKSCCYQTYSDTVCWL